MKAVNVCLLCALLAVGCGGDDKENVGGTGPDMDDNNNVSMDAGTDDAGGQDDVGAQPDAAPDDDADITPEDMGGADMPDDAGADDMMMANQAPVANAGLDQASVFKQRMVTLNGAFSSDPDGDALTYAWTQLSGETVTLSDPAAAQPSFTSPPVGSVLVFQLTVSDGIASDDDDVSVTVVNRPPLANAGIGQDAQQGQLVTLDASQSDDADGDALTFAWTQVSGANVSLSDTTSPTPTFTAPNAFGALVFEVTVSDGEDSDTDQTQVSVINLPPVAEAGPDQNVQQGDPVTLDGTSSFDPEGLPLSYSWTQVGGPSNVTLSDSTAAAPTFTAPVGMGGAFVFELVVNDGNSDSMVDRTRVTTPNNPPVANAGTDGVANGGEVVFLDGTGSFDPDGDPFDYLWTQTAGTPVEFGEGDRARAYFKVPAGLSETLSFQLTVSNTQGVDSDTVSFQTTAWNGVAAALPPNPFATTLRPFTMATYGIDMAGNLLFAVGNNQGGDDLAVYDVTAPDTPALLATAKAGGTPSFVLFDGTTAFVMAGSNLEVYDFDAGAGTLSLLDTEPLPGGSPTVQSMVRDGDVLYVALFDTGAGSFALAAFDVQTLTAVTLLHSELSARADSLAVRPGELWVGGFNELSVYDTSSITGANPAFVELTDATDDHCSFVTRSIVIQGNTLFAACDANADLAVFDITTSADPVLVTTLNEPGAGQHVLIDQNTAYVSAAAGGVLLFDVTTPSTPSFLGSIPTTQTADVSFVGNALFTLVASDEIDVLPNVIRTPEFASSLPLSFSIRAMDYQNDRLAVSASDVQIVDVADPTNPQITSTINASGADAIVLDFPYLYAAAGSAGLSIYDIQVPAQPVTLTTLLNNLDYRGVHLDGTRLAAPVSDDGVALFDVSNQSSPAALGTYNPGEDFRAALLDGDTLYGAAWADGLYVVDITNPATPMQLGFVSHTSPRGELDKSGDYLWNGFGAISFVRFDVSNPMMPTSQYLGVDLGGVEQIRANGALAWAALGETGVATIDVSDPANPVILERYSVITQAEAIKIGDDEVWFGDGDVLRSIRIDNAVFATRYVTAPTSSTLTYDVSWQEPGTDAEARCFVSGGSCSVTAFSGAARTATVEWDVPTSVGDHEIAVVVGHGSTRAFLRDRVSIQ